MDIQAKLQAGKGPGYERWAKVFNLKQMAQTINFLTENNITDYETLVEKTKAVTDRYHELSQQIKQIEKRMAEIIEMQNHIINYSKTKDVFLAYKESGYSKKYYEEYAGDILIHRSAKNAFNDLRGRKISSIQELKSEYATLVDKKRMAHGEYTNSRVFHRQIQNALANVTQLIGIEKEVQSKKISPQR